MEVETHNRVLCFLNYAAFYLDEAREQGYDGAVSADAFFAIDNAVEVVKEVRDNINKLVTRF